MTRDRRSAGREDGKSVGREDGRPANDQGRGGLLTTRTADD